MEHFWLNENDESVRSFSTDDDGNHAGTIVAFSARSPENEAVNEDSMGLFSASSEALVLAVADGMGGGSCGDRASQAVIQHLSQKLAAVIEPTACRGAILDAIETANEEIIDWGIGAGATLAVALIGDGQVRAFHVGDAVVLLCSNRGRVKYSTVAHSPVGMAEEIGLLNDAEAIRHEDRNLISNCIGDREMRIEIGPNVKMGIHDTLVVGSDGLFDNLLTKEIVDFIRGRGLKSRMQKMLNLAMTRMRGVAGNHPAKPDDLSVLGFRRGKQQVTKQKLV